MSAQGLEVIDHTVQLTHEWVNDLTTRLEWSSRKDVLRLLRATLTALRDHMTPAQVAKFAAQLPLLIRGMYYEGWVVADTPAKDRDLEHFLTGIEDRVRDVREYRGRSDIRAALHVIEERISEGEIADVRAGLPRHIREFWS